MKKTTASLLAGISVWVFAAVSSHGQTYVDFSQQLYGDNFETYDLGTYPANISIGNKGTYDPAVVIDSGNLFNSGTANQYLQFHKTRHTTMMVDFDHSEVVRLSFDFIPRNVPVEGTLDKDGRWLSIPFFADPTGTLLDNNARAQLTQLTVTTGKMRGVTGSPSFGNLDELVHFDIFFNNSIEAINYDAPDGNVHSLDTGLTAIWTDNLLLVAGYSTNRATDTLGYGVHRVGFQIDSNDNGIVTFDLDNVEVFGVIPEPSTYALLFGGFALAGALFVRRRRRA